MRWLKKLFGCKEEELNIEINRLNELIIKKDQELKTLKNTIKSSTPKKLGQISYSDVVSLMTPHMPDISNLLISDKYFATTSVDNAKKFSEETKVWARKWEEEVHDCDNFSFALMGYWSEGLESFSFGIAWTKKHAFNFFIDNNKQIWIVEPQTNKYIKLEELKNNSTYYPFRLVLL